MNELNHIDIMKHWSDGILEFCRIYLLSSPLLPQAQETFSGGSKATRLHIWYMIPDISEYCIHPNGLLDSL